MVLPKRLTDGAVIGQEEKLDDAANVGRAFQGNGYPPGSRQNVMGLGTTRGNQFIPDAPGERQVGKPRVQMTQFASTQPQLHAAKTMVVYGHALPGRNL